MQPVDDGDGRGGSTQHTVWMELLCSQSGTYMTSVIESLLGYYQGWPFLMSTLFAIELRELLLQTTLRTKELVIE